ncbi:MAG TPA: tol-pal system-associated acyl-CoA thioesterase [Caldimonas sp.]|jgi:acyl-CoA thioester hydrolase|nr:tol-pal system-associated acyl-CoA thioesterase [Caldimonas sp.]HEV7576252.1 tol-pal system-associated acyl-CoA thioesterase [Caldimonas sp.]
MKRSDPAAFSVAMRIYWEDTDAAGIVFYANYLKYFERARTEWLRGLGFGQEALRRDAGIAFVVSETALRYRRPARLDDVIDVSVAVVHLGQASLEIAQEARRAGELLADGTIRIGCIELGTFRPCRIPNDIRLSIHR